MDLLLGGKFQRKVDEEFRCEKPSKERSNSRKRNLSRKPAFFSCEESFQFFSLFEKANLSRMRNEYCKWLEYLEKCTKFKDLPISGELRSFLTQKLEKANFEIHRVELRLKQLQKENFTSVRGTKMKLFDIGSVYMFLGDYDKALNSFKEAQKHTSSNEILLRSILYQQLALLYKKCWKNKKSLKYFRKSMKTIGRKHTKKSKNFQFSLTEHYKHMIAVLLRLNKTDEALHLCQQLIKRTGFSTDRLESSTLFECYLLVAVVYSRHTTKYKIDEVRSNILVSCNNAFNQAKKNVDKKGMSLCIMHKAAFLYKLGSFEDALRYYECDTGVGDFSVFSLMDIGKILYISDEKEKARIFIVKAVNRLLKQNEDIEKCYDGYYRVMKYM